MKELKSEGVEERMKLLERLRHASVVLHDPSIHPDNMEPERLEHICSELRVGDPDEIMEDDFRLHRD